MRIVRLSAAVGVALLLGHAALAKPTAVMKCSVGSTPIKVPYPSSFVDASLVPEANVILREHNALEGRTILCDFLAKDDARRVLSSADFSIGRFASLQAPDDDPEHVWSREEFALVKDAFRELYEGDGHKKRQYTESDNQIGFFELVNYMHEGWEKSLALSLNLVLANGKILFVYVYSDNRGGEDLRFVQEVGQRWGEAITEMNPPVSVRLSQR